MGWVLGLAALFTLAPCRGQNLDASTTSPGDATNAPDASASPAVPSASADLVQRRLNFLTKQLDLSAAQQAQLLPILKEEQDKEDAAFGNQNQGEDNAAIREIRKAGRQHIIECLTPEQRPKFVGLKPFVRTF